MATLHLIAPARQRAKPTPCGNRPTRLPAGKVSTINDLWPFSAFTRAACPQPCLQLAITPARLSAWSSLPGKVLEGKTINYENITTGNNSEQSCLEGNYTAFRNIMELAHNICLLVLDRIRNLKDKIKDFERSAESMDYGSFSSLQILFNWPRVRIVLHDC